MKLKTISLITLLFINTQSFNQDTFSIVAVDETTGEVGGAGASCLDESQFPGSGGVLLIHEIFPGRGVIHTQSYYLPGNQQNAANQLLSGHSPQEVVDWLAQDVNDVQANATQRQYGVADFDSLGNARSAAFTGVNCMDYKNQIIGSNYAIQGNILIGQEILDSMEARFLNTGGELADKLMAALQGAKIPGADTRCLGEGVSSLSAFVRVAKPNDSLSDLYLDISIPETPFGVEPIDSLQILFDDWKSSQTGGAIPDFNEQDIFIYPNPVDVNFSKVVFKTSSGGFDEIRFYDQSGKPLKLFQNSSNHLEISMADFSKGIYFYTILKGGMSLKNGKVVLI